MQTAFSNVNVVGTACWTYDPYAVKEVCSAFEEVVDEECSQSDELVSVVNSACDMLSVPSTDEEETDVEEDEDAEEVEDARLMHPKMKKFSAKHSLCIKIPDTCVTLKETRFYRHDPYSSEFSVKLVLN